MILICQQLRFSSDIFIDDRGTVEVQFNLRRTFIFSHSKGSFQMSLIAWQKSPEIMAWCHRRPNTLVNTALTTYEGQWKRMKLIKAVINERKSLSPRCCCCRCLVFFLAFCILAHNSIIVNHIGFTLDLP